jgi:hypothetical protein
MSLIICPLKKHDQSIDHGDFKSMPVTSAKNLNCLVPTLRSVLLVVFKSSV